MKKLFLASIAMVALNAGSPAWAADLPRKAPPPLVYGWTGFYIGGGFGYGAYTFRNQDFITTTRVVESREYSSGGKGWLGTVIVGADYQFAERWVAGVFADYDWTSIKGDHVFHDAGYSGTLRLLSAWAAGGRLGYLVTPSTLLYATGGYTAARFSDATFFFSPTGICCFQNGATFRGWFVGAGAETQLWANWYGRLEYRYAGYRAELVPVFEANGTPYGGTGVSTRIEPTVQTIRADLTYRFNWASPAVAAPYRPVGGIYKAPVRPAPVYVWTGVYAGGGFGYGAYTFRNQDFFNGVFPGTIPGAPAGFEFSSGGKGWLGTVIVGADYQFAERWVAGVFADYDWTDIKGEHTLLDSATIGTLKLKSAWAVGGRLGYLFAPTTLFYATGGYTEAQFDGITLFEGFGPVFNPNPFGFQNGTTYRGWFVGTGAETQLWANWFGRIEYRYAAYRSEDSSVFLADGSLFGIFTRMEPTVQTIRADLTYRFNWASPVVAKY
jgi:outer membrane immunogenic protein